MEFPDDFFVGSDFDELGLFADEDAVGVLFAVDPEEEFDGAGGGGGGEVEVEIAGAVVADGEKGGHFWGFVFPVVGGEGVDGAVLGGDADLKFVGGAIGSGLDMPAFVVVEKFDVCGETDFAGVTFGFEGFAGLGVGGDVDVPVF